MDCLRSGVLGLCLVVLIVASEVSAVQKVEKSSSGLSSDAQASVGSTLGSSSQPAISSNSVLVALLDSHYTELAELVEKALLLQPLEEVVGSSNITIFAPQNAVLERKLDPEFKQFLHEPGNLKSLQKLLMFHVVPRRIVAEQWGNKVHQTLAKDGLRLSEKGGKKSVDLASISHPNAVIRPDGVIHGIDKMLIPKSVQDDFNQWRREALAVIPQGAPVVDPRNIKSTKKAASTKDDYTPEHSIYYAMASAPSLAPAPAPGPGTGHHWFDGEAQVKDFIHTLVHYGGYNELADILVNLTSLATEVAKIVSEGYRVTVLAPNDEALGKLTTDQLSEPGAPEQIVYYHIIPEYQTEESMYNAVRRFGKIKYDTLRVPHKITATEADGTVLFGDGEHSAHLYDHDIYIDGRISVQGIDKVLYPAEEIKKTKGRKLEEEKTQVKTTNHTRGRLLGAVCGLFERVGGISFVSSCQ
ncbi:fasciclin-like arabinogalactan protein 17 [Cryptomeria japonica]|uniref:fasciclin-like arabinogalactan protein 17 n=1 Tax=Cryptomeria japonica TaxID=3369 RepID=UPI0027D9E845|nr:fasciclin-like arabinogalactan protein 17 [Cryptomeria japonica]